MGPCSQAVTKVKVIYTHRHETKGNKNALEVCPLGETALYTTVAVVPTARYYHQAQGEVQDVLP